MEIFGLMILLSVLGGTIYLPAREDWNKTFQRAAQIMRANMTGKAIQPQLGTKPPASATHELAVWQAQFDGKSASKEILLADKNYHTIIRSWNELNDNRMEGVTERWYWECSCEVKEHRKTAEASKNAARRHLKLYGGRNEEGVKNEGWLRGVK
jgi:hypothetical protein